MGCEWDDVLLRLKYVFFCLPNNQNSFLVSVKFYSFCLELGLYESKPTCLMIVHVSCSTSQLDANTCKNLPLFFLFNHWHQITNPFFICSSFLHRHPSQNHHTPCPRHHLHPPSLWSPHGNRAWLLESHSTLLLDSFHTGVGGWGTRRRRGVSRVGHVGKHACKACNPWSLIFKRELAPRIAWRLSGLGRPSFSHKIKQRIKFEESCKVMVRSVS